MFTDLFSEQKRFVQLLSTQERTVLVHAFAYLAHLDHTLKQEEIDSISTAAHNLGLDPQIIVADSKQADIEDILKTVENDRAKRIIIQELIHLAYTDGEYSQEERAGVKQIAELVGIEPQLFARIEQWVEAGIALEKEGIPLILEGK